MDEQQSTNRDSINQGSKPLQNSLNIQDIPFIKLMKRSERQKVLVLKPIEELLVNRFLRQGKDPVKQQQIDPIEKKPKSILRNKYESQWYKQSQQESQIKHNSFDNFQIKNLVELDQVQKLQEQKSKQVLNNLANSIQIRKKKLSFLNDHPEEVKNSPPSTLVQEIFSCDNKHKNEDLSQKAVKNQYFFKDNNINFTPQPEFTKFQLNPSSYSQSVKHLPSKKIYQDMNNNLSPFQNNAKLNLLQNSLQLPQHLQYQSQHQQHQQTYLPSLLEKYIQNSQLTMQQKQYSTADADIQFSFKRTDLNTMFYILDNQIIKFNLLTQTFSKKKFDFPYCQFSYVKIQDSKMVITGGIDSYKKNAITFAYEVDCDTRKIQPLESMNYPRFDHSLIFVDNVVYALGGRASNGIPQKSCEKYTCEGNQWQWVLIAPMNYPRSSMSIAIQKSTRSIFVFGNPYFKEKNLIFEKYDIQSNKWEVIRVEMPEQPNLRNFFLFDVYCKIAINDAQTYQQKLQIYVFASQFKSKSLNKEGKIQAEQKIGDDITDLSLLIDVSSQDVSFNMLRPVPISKNSQIIVKSYEILILDLDTPNKGTRFSLGNWQKTEIQFKNAINY